MRVRVIAVGTRLPAWARTACSDYLGRLGRPGITFQEIASGTRSARGPVRQAVAAEGQRLLGVLRASEHVAALDERGIELSTYELATWLKARRPAGQASMAESNGTPSAPHSDNAVKASTTLMAASQPAAASRRLARDRMRPEKGGRTSASVSRSAFLVLELPLPMAGASAADGACGSGNRSRNSRTVSSASSPIAMA